MVHERYLGLITATLAAELGEALRGAYVIGSAAVGASGPGSDIDVLVAVEGADGARLEAVAARCAHEVIPCPARKLEMVVYETVVLAAPTDRPSWSLNLNTGPRLHRVGWTPEAEPPHWFVIDLAFARRHARPLLGPPPAALIADPGASAVRSAMAAMVDWYERNEPEHAPVARARARHWLATGQFARKTDFES